MDALDPVEFDVARRARPADPGQRSGGVEAGERVRHPDDDLLGPDDDEVQGVCLAADPPLPLSRPDSGLYAAADVFV